MREAFRGIRTSIKNSRIKLVMAARIGFSAITCENIMGPHAVTVLLVCRRMAYNVLMGLLVIQPFVTASADILPLKGTEYYVSCSPTGHAYNLSSVEEAITAGANALAASLNDYCKNYAPTAFATYGPYQYVNHLPISYDTYRGVYFNGTDPVYGAVVGEDWGVWLNFTGCTLGHGVSAIGVCSVYKVEPACPKGEILGFLPPGACHISSSSFIIKLSRADGSTESGTVIESVEPTDMFSNASGKNATYLLAKVYDQNGQLVPNVAIQLTVDVVANSGGHQHDDADRHTNYMGQLASPQGTVEQNGKVLKDNTGSNGLAFTFTAPEPAGDHFFTATCTDGKTCTLQGPDTVWVGIKNLVPIPHATDASGFQLYTLIGQDDFHPNNHYVTSDALTSLTTLAGQYRDEFPNDPPLYLNDASLERGGVFDIKFDPYTDNNGVYHARTTGSLEGHYWVAPHIEHRRGTVIDIRANGTRTAIPPENYNQFKFILQMLKIRYLYEGDHFHVRLLGLSQ